MGRMFQTIGVNPRYEIVPILQGLLNLLTRGQNLRINSELLRGYESPSIFMTKTIEEIKIEDLTLLDTNPRQVRTGAIQRLAKSLSGPRGRDLFVKRPCLVNKRDGKLIVYAGNQRLRAAQSLKWQTVPCIVDEISIEQEREETIKDNLVIGEWDTDILANTFDMKELEDWGMDLKDLGIDFGKEDETDEVPEPPKEARAERGKIYQLGKHRVMCGDSTNAGDVALLMDGKKADMVFTDPPYGVAVNQGSKDDLKARNRRTDGKTVENDTLKGEGLKSFLLKVFENIGTHLKDGGVLYVCHAEGLGMDVIFRTAFSESGFKPAEIIIWVKDQFAFGRQDYHWRHEPIIYGWKEGAAHYFVDDHTQDTVWNIDRPKRSEEHPTMKPIELCAKGVKNSSVVGEIVSDMFLGSGSTLIACEQTGRICYGCEIDPKYVDVIIERYCNYTKTDKEEIYAKA